jgi:hypothetical protein
LPTFLCPDWLETAILQISASCIAWDDRQEPPYPDIGWDEVSLTFCLSWPQTTVLSYLSLTDSYDYRHEPLAPGSCYFLNIIA